jgi:hypothetical protein
MMTDAEVMGEGADASASFYLLLNAVPLLTSVALILTALRRDCQNQAEGGSSQLLWFMASEFMIL